MSEDFGWWLVTGLLVPLAWLCAAVGLFAAVVVAVMTW